MSNLRLHPVSHGPLFPIPAYKRGFTAALLVAVSIISVFILASPVLAHHPLGGELPANWVEGFQSGLAHPILGPDHFVFVIAVGLLASIKPRGWSILLAFIATGLVGSGIHLMALDLPNPEFFISASVLIFGLMLAIKNGPNVIVLSGLAAIAGLFHGYAYGEAIIGAEPTPLAAYLIGFSLIQLAIALLSFRISQSVLQKNAKQPLLTLQSVGFAISGAGAAFLSSVVLG
ncbi:MAG: HupE/UreJ family protein [Leptolyngbyaceae cyanobacterium MO_188.B28]|nr:HupE/UreJ family protein [Leptolyngbyaceae cyanobacterium MO_188.B28]